jgi:hypothetical protein
MQAIEIEAPIVDHRLVLHSDKLPAHASRAKVIVMYDENDQKTVTDILTLARAARNCFPQVEREQLQAEFSAMRTEWEQREHGP